MLPVRDWEELKYRAGRRIDSLLSAVAPDLRAGVLEWDTLGVLICGLHGAGRDQEVAPLLEILATYQATPLQADRLRRLAAQAWMFAGKFDKADALLDQISIQAVIDQERVLADRIKIRLHQGDITGAKALIRGLKVEDPDLLNLRGWLSIYDGQLTEGIKLMRAAQMRTTRRDSINSIPELQQGQKLSGLRILLRSFGGAGDEVLGLRWVSALSAQGAKVTLASRHGLESIFARVGDANRVLPDPQIQSADFDCWVDPFDLPFLLQTEVIPPMPDLSGKSLHRVSDGCLRVGIRWEGMRYTSWLERDLRSVPPDELASAISLKGVDAVSLQRDASIELSSGFPVHTVPLTDWGTTVAQIEALDLVITSCTSIAHLACALGVETWVLVPTIPYYPWVGATNESLWYPTARIFRKRKMRSWAEPLAEVRAALSRRLGPWISD